MTRGATALMLVALFVVEVAANFETAMIYAALGQMIREFGDPIKVGWLVTGYLLTATACTAIAARIGDLSGRRRAILVILAIAVGASILSAMSNRFDLILLGRILQGIAFSTLPLSCGLISAKLPPDKVPIAIGITIAGASAGAALGLVGGGLIVDHLGWHAIFYASAILGALSFLLVALFVPRDIPVTDGRPVNIVSGILFVPAIAALLLYLSSVSRLGWVSPFQLATFAAALILMALWVYLSLRERNPLLDVRLFARRPVLATNAAIAIFALGALQVQLVFATLLLAPTWAGGIGASATVAGLVKTPANVIALLAPPLGGWIVGRHGGRTAMLIGLVIAGVGWTLLGLFGTSIAAVGVILVIAVLGTAMTYGTAPSLLVPIVPKDRVSEATGMLMVVRSTFLATGAQIVAILLASDTVRHGTESYPSAGVIRLLIFAVAALTFAAAAAALLLPRGGGGHGRSTDGADS